MPRIISYLLVIAFWFTACQPDQDDPPKVGDWQILLDKDLLAWEKMGAFKASVENEILKLEAEKEGQNAWLHTKADYTNFQLEGEFMGALAQSSILIRFDPRLRATADIASYQLSLDPNPDQQLPLGSITHAARAKTLEEFDPSSWNSFQIEANGDYLRVSINEELVAETHDRRRIIGKLALGLPKSTDTAISFKNLRIKPLASTEIEKQTLEEQFRTHEEIPLLKQFEGENFEGWEHAGDGGWNFEGDVLHGFSGEKGGYLISKEIYHNFYMKLQFKIEKEDNSGIFIRRHPDSTQVSLQDAIECNIYDHNGFTHAYSTGSIVGKARAWYGMIDHEKWNEMEIFAKDDLLILYINGQKSATSYVAPQFNKAGNICLQAGIKIFAEDKGPSHIYFKEVFIRNMDGLSP